MIFGVGESTVISKHIGGRDLASVSAGVMGFALIWPRSP